MHDRAVHAGVEPRGRLVEEEQRRLRQQLQCDADALALAAGEAVDRLFRPLFQSQLTYHFGDPGPAFGRVGVVREAEFGGVPEGAVHGQLGVQDVVLRDEPDAMAQLGVVVVEVSAVVEDAALVGRPEAGQRVEQGGFAGAARAHHAQQTLLAHREGDIVEQGLAAPVHGDRQVLYIERDLTGVDELLQHVADQRELGVTDADDVTGGDRGTADQLAVEIRAVVRAEVDDLVRAVRMCPQFGVPVRDGQVVDDEVVVGAAADPYGMDGPRPHGGRLPERAGGSGHGDGGRAVGRVQRGGCGGLADQNGARPVRGVTEPDDAAGAHARLMDALAPGVCTVRAVLVLQGPVVVHRPEHRMVPRHPDIVDDDVAQWVAADVVIPARAHHRGTCIGFEHKFGGSRRDRSVYHARILSIGPFMCLWVTAAISRRSGTYTLHHRAASHDGRGHGRRLFCLRDRTGLRCPGPPRRPPWPRPAPGRGDRSRGTTPRRSCRRPRCPRGGRRTRRSPWSP